MAWLAFFQANPGLLSGVPIYLIVAVMIARHMRFPKRYLFNSLLGFGIVFAVIFAQSFFRNENAIIVAMVSDPRFRETITKGTYLMDNGVSWISVIRMLVFALVTIMFAVSLNRSNNQERYIAYLVNSALASFLVVFVLSNVMGAHEFKAMISPFTSLESNNYLTSDGYGYRISGFFHEPSHSSLFFGAALAALFVLRKAVMCRFYVFGILFILFVMSRSVSILAVFILALFFLYAPKWAALAALATSALLQVVLKFVAEYYATSGLFRSVYERSFSSELFNTTTMDRLIGFDFGQVYSFEPIVGLTLQVGILGLVGLYFILQRDVRTVGFFVFSFALTPQLWYYPAWAGVGVFMIALHAKQMDRETRKGPSFAAMASDTNLGVPL